ncbi:11040_t:CDS:2 [Funneliformis caledonium]|uniref:11040_t:CDS:1 n=1 Tax=Funneliformis caledonium TaxID=1117310 RepID=A0A9N8V5F6_9GLOM|nr:11040_t:CDS:2 [Funneliformis caledonium]
MNQQDNYDNIKSHPLNIMEYNGESILENFRFVEGRRFHNVEGVVYFLANDEEEISRLQMLHHLYKYIWKSVYSSPMHGKLASRGTRVLDSGCGPGSWVLDMANHYENSTFIGVDFSPSMFPSHVSNNVAFLETNIISGFPFPNETFDFVYQRLMCFALTKKQWQDVILDMVRITKPGGWIEFMEVDIEVYFAGPLTKRFMKLFRDLLTSRGLDPFIASRIEGYLQATNKVVDVHIESKATPLGSHGKGVGELLGDDFWVAISHTKAYICNFMGIPIEKYDILVEKIKKEYDEYKSYSKSYR